MENNFFKFGKYRHYKGNEYEVIGRAKHTETLEERVVYRALVCRGRFVGVSAENVYGGGFG